MQAVFLQVSNKIFPFLPKSEVLSWEKGAMKIYAQNIEIAREHGRLHKAMTDHGIPYIVIKGLSSAKYYSQPLERTFGDVDLIISPDRIEDAYKLVLGLGYKINGTKKVDLSQDIGLYRYQGAHHVVLDLHPKMNYFPSGEVSKIVGEYLFDLIESGKVYSVDENECKIPDKRHHCLIMLIHMAGHLTREGIGLRHLCDWAAFLNNISDEEFCKDYQGMLEKCGLFRFAQVMTLVCEKYLDMSKRAWSGKADPELLEGVINDIMKGGNFGYKDLSRYQHIKYLKKVDDNTVDKKNPMRQVLHSIHAKAKDRHSLLMRSFLTYPLGWGAIIMKYLLLLITGSRKNHNPVSIIREAWQRQMIYQKLKIYDINI